MRLLLIPPDGVVYLYACILAGVEPTHLYAVVALVKNEVMIYLQPACCLVCGHPDHLWCAVVNDNLHLGDIALVVA